MNHNIKNHLCWGQEGAAVEGGEGADGLTDQGEHFSLLNHFETLVGKFAGKILHVNILDKYVQRKVLGFSLPYRPPGQDAALQLTEAYCIRPNLPSFRRERNNEIHFD